VRTTGDPAKYAAAVRAELAKVDRSLVISKLQPMDAVVAQDQRDARLPAGQRLNRQGYRYRLTGPSSDRF